MNTIDNKNTNLRKDIYNILHIIIIIISLFLVLSISIDTFNNVLFVTESSYLQIQFWVCIFFLGELFVELFFAKKKLRFLRTHFFFLLISVPYLNIIHYFNIEYSAEASYFIRFIPLIRGGYALAMVVNWLTQNKAFGLFLTYSTTLVVTVYFSTLIFFVVEHNTNPAVNSYMDALWWALMNVTTVGSNIFAVTTTGKVLSFVIAAVGMMMFPIFTVYITSIVQRTNEKRKKGNDKEDE